LWKHFKIKEFIDCIAHAVVDNLVEAFVQTTTEPLESLLEAATHHRVGTFATGAAICLSVVLLCWVPLCFKSFKDVAHYCPSCGSQVAYHKTGR
jgi:hypothetical protein